MNQRTSADKDPEVDDLTTSSPSYRLVHYQPLTSLASTGASVIHCFDNCATSIKDLNKQQHEGIACHHELCGCPMAAGPKLPKVPAYLTMKSVQASSNQTLFDDKDAINQTSFGKQEHRPQATHPSHVPPSGPGDGEEGRGPQTAWTFPYATRDMTPDTGNQETRPSTTTV